MTQPDAAGTRSLEEILASIRKSLSEETVDGIVELSAAAAAAARAESKPANGGKSAATAAPKRETKAEPERDTLSDKLAGALGGSENPVDDLADVLAEPAPQPSIAAKSVPGKEPAKEEAKDPLWFLRPGAPEQPSGEMAKRPAPKLEIDPKDRLGAAVEKKLAAEPDQEQVLTTPRLDPERLNRINARPTTPVAVEPEPELEPELAPEETIAKASEEREVEPEPEPEEMTAKAPEEPEVEPAPTVATTVPAEPSPPAAVTAPAASAAPDPAAETGILSRREAPRVPLFGGATDKRKPIISAPLAGLPLKPADEPYTPPPAGGPKSPAPAAEKSEAAPEKTVSPQPVASGRLADVIEKIRAEAGKPAETTSPEAAEPVAAFKPEAVLAAAAPGVPPGASKPLEQMIAAVLEPVLQRLLEKNLAPMLEEMVRREVEKALQDERR